jgi:hypothetical protein
MTRDCTTCANLQTFTPRPDEPCGQGCRALGWEGYVVDATKPPCQGVNGPIRYAPNKTAL